MMIKEKLKDFRYYLRDITINRRMRSRLINKDFSIITNDCLGGSLSKDLKLQMRSPTRNFYFNAKDFIKFCKNLDHYLSCIPEEYNGDYKDEGSQYLMASLDDLILFLVHYKSIEQAQVEWKRRVLRVNKNNLFFVMNDRNFCTEDDISEFDSLPYQNKVFFSHVPLPQYKSVFYIRGSEEDDYIKTITKEIHPWSIKRYYDQFDFVRWLNEGKK